MALRVAVVGAGIWDSTTQRIYSNSRDGIGGVVDIDEERAREVALRYGSRAYRDYREILVMRMPLSIVVPTTDHFDVALN